MRLFTSTFFMLLGVLTFILHSVSASSQTHQELQCKNIFINSSVNHAISNLAKLYLKLELAKVQGTSSLMLTALSHDYKAESEKLINYIKSNNLMTDQQLTEKLKIEITNLQISKDELTKDETQARKNEVFTPTSIARKMIYHKIKPGKFKMGKYNIHTEITKPFEMMSTKVTQMMWARLMIALGEKNIQLINPSKFKSGDHSTIINIDDIDIQMQPDHPVEQVSWKDVNKLVDGLNRLSLSSDEKTFELLVDIIPDHQKGDIYSLPTEAQWEYVMKNLGQADKKYFDQDEYFDIVNYAWLFENSDFQTHPVATKLPRIIDDKPFYDLEGNVSEWTNDSAILNENFLKRSAHWFKDKIVGRKDPQGHNSKDKQLYLKVIRGYDYLDKSKKLNPIENQSYGDNLYFSSLGFRLVRYRP